MWYPGIVRVNTSRNKNVIKIVYDADKSEKGGRSDEIIGAFYGNQYSYMEENFDLFVFRTESGEEQLVEFNKAMTLNTAAPSSEIARTTSRKPAKQSLAIPLDHGSEIEGAVSGFWGVGVNSIQINGLCCVREIDVDNDGVVREYAVEGLLVEKKRNKFTVILFGDS